MKLNEIMTSEVHTIEGDATIRQAAEEMASLDVGLIPVMDNGKPIGVITDRDITVRAIAQGQNPEKASVRGTMTAETESISSDAEVEEAVRLMEQKQIRRLLVTDGKGNLKGIVSLGDLATRC
jgi:CBS domain-containing protein